MSVVRRGCTAAVTAGTVAALLVVSGSSSSAGSANPSLRFVGVLDTVEVQRFGDTDDVFVGAGIYVAAVNGPFELHARRTATGVTVVQVERQRNGDTKVIRRLPAERSTSFDAGLGRFFEMTWRNGAGAIVARSEAPFCPGAAWQPQRLDDSGPETATYPASCGNSSTTGATVWGIHQGWATPALNSVPNPAVADGTYRLTVGIRAFWVRALGLPRVSPVTVTAHVTTQTASECDPEPCEEPPFEPTSNATGAGISDGSSGSSSSTSTTTTETSHGRRPRVADGLVPNARDVANQAQRLLGARRERPGALPDLAALPAWSLTVEADEEGRDLLGFAATVWNAGRGPLIVEGFRSTSRPSMTAWQYFKRGDATVAKALVGELEFDTRVGHDHWHFEDFAKYDLVSKASGRTVLSDKQSFCLVPTDAIDLTIPGAVWQPGMIGLGSACGSPDSIWLRETMPVGWGDTYYQNSAGQAFDVTGVANGEYTLRITANFERRLKESNYSNNLSTLRVQLGGKRGARTVTLLRGS